MINVQDLTKTFDRVKALDGLNINVEKGSIYGLVGANGAGKTTVIKHITGILKPDSGRVLIDGEPVYENPKAKVKNGYVPDELYFFPSYSLDKMASYLKGIYPVWNDERFINMVSNFKLDSRMRLSSFSKGMKKQADFILTMCAMPECLILDEPIDGLDPIVRKTVWRYIIKDVAEREITVMVSSHNLREMEGYCDHIGIISKGKMFIERDLEDLRSNIHKVQVAYPGPHTSDMYTGLDILHKESRGSVDIMIIRNSREKIENIIRQSGPSVFDILPLTLEEIFIYELGGVEDEYRDIII